MKQNVVQSESSSSHSHKKLRYYSSDSESEYRSEGTLHIDLDMFIRRRAESPAPSICFTANSQYPINRFPVGATTITRFTQTPTHLAEFVAHSSEAGSGVSGDEPGRPLKRPRLVWTPQLHKGFVDAVARLGIKNAVPKTILQLMSVDGLTREDVANHLQKYRSYIKRMKASSGGGKDGDTAFAAVAAASIAIDLLLAAVLDSPNRNGGMKVQSLFPTGED